MNWKNWFRWREEPVVWQDGSLAEDVRESVRIGQILGREDGSVAYQNLKGPGGAKRSEGVGVFESDLDRNPPEPQGDLLEIWKDARPTDKLPDGGLAAIVSELSRRILVLEKIERRRELDAYPPVLVTSRSKNHHHEDTDVKSLRDTVVVMDKEFGEPKGEVN